jgi:hypothetical protein
MILPEQRNNDIKRNLIILIGLSQSTPNQPGNARISPTVSEM